MWPLTIAMCSTLVWPNLVAIEHLYSEFDFWSKRYVPLWSGVLLTKCGGHRVFLSNLTSDQPHMTPMWPLTPALCSTGQGFLWSNVVAIGNSYVISPLVDPIWPPSDLWPQHSVPLWSGVLLTKFGAHRSLLSNLTLVWPQMTHAWPLNPVLHYIWVRGSSDQIW